MGLFHLLYKSIRKDNCDESEINNILESCKRNNPSKDISGVLLYSDTHFIQYLEGDSKEITALYDGIKEDDRHKNAIMLSYGPAKDRAFPNWAMGSKKVDQSNIKYQTDISATEKITFDSLIETGKADGHMALKFLKGFFETGR